MTPNGNEQAFPDRKGFLFVTGVCDILAGCFLLLLAPLTLVTLGISQATREGSAVSPGRIVGTVAFYVLLGGALIGIGVGLCRCLRWARALMLALSWTWLIAGSGTLLFMLLLLPRLMAARPDMPGGALVQGILFAVMGFIYIVVPGLHIVFLRGPHAEATCRRYDPRERWTDRLPLPVLVLLVFQLVGLLGMLSTFSYGPVFLFFGAILEGWAAGAMILLVVLLFAWLIKATYGLRREAWWVGLGVILLWVVSSGITLSRHSMAILYEKMNLAGREAEGVTQELGGAFPYLGLLACLPYVALLLYCRRYFKRELPEPLPS